VSARLATATASSLQGGSKSALVNDGDLKTDWASNAEKQGAWVQLTWPNAITIDSAALWDRSNPDDQVLSGVLTFSDGSSVQVGTLPNDASAPGTVAFSPKTITWIKFTVSTAKSTTANVGLAELEVFSTGACLVNESHPIIAHQPAAQMLSVAEKGILVSVPANQEWKLELFELNGSKIAGYCGKGATQLPIGSIMNCGFVIARMRSGAHEFEKTLAKY
jgi:hypothetical protein